MKNILALIIFLCISGFQLLAQEVSNPVESKNELDELKYHPYNPTEDLKLKLGAKKLTTKPYNSHPKKLKVYKGSNKILNTNSVSQELIFKKWQPGLTTDMPDTLPFKKYYLSSVYPADSAAYNPIVIDKVGKTETNQE